MKSIFYRIIELTLVILIMSLIVWALMNDGMNCQSLSVPTTIFQNSNRSFSVVCH